MILWGKDGKKWLIINPCCRVKIMNKIYIIDLLRKDFELQLQEYDTLLTTKMTFL